MAQIHQRITSPETDSASAKAGRSDLVRQIIDFARTTGSVHTFFPKAFRLLTQWYSSPYAALYLSYASQIIQDDWHTGPTDPGFWKASIQSFLSDTLDLKQARARLLNAKQGTLKVAFLGAPIFNSSGVCIGAVAMVVQDIDPEEIRSHLAVLESMLQLAVFAIEARVSGRGGGEESSGPNASVTRMSEYTTPEELAFALTASIRNRYNCEQVALGMVTPRQVRILSISGLDEVFVRNPGVIPIQEAMMECLDFDRTLISQRADSTSEETEPVHYCLHKQWQGAAGGDAVASIPLHAKGRVAAVLSLRRDSGMPFTAGQLQDIQNRVEPYAPVLLTIHQASRGLARHAMDAAWEHVRVLSAKGQTRKKAVYGAIGMLLLCFFFLPLNYHVNATCRVVPVEIRHLTMPFDGVVAGVLLNAGQPVRKGEILCRLDTRDLMEQRAQLAAQVRVLDHEIDKAMSTNDPVNVRLSESQKKLVATQLVILDEKIARCEVRSPVEGIVISGDLGKNIGNVLSKGEALYEVAPRTGWRLEMDIPERDIDDVREGQTGWFSTFARPEEAQIFQVDRIRPLAEIRNGKNIFPVEAETSLSLNWIRSGMEGVASIQAGKRVIWRLLFQRVIDYIHMTLWL